MLNATVYVRPANPPPIATTSRQANDAMVDALDALLAEVERLARRHFARQQAAQHSGAGLWRRESTELRIEVLRNNHLRAHGMTMRPPRSYTFF